MSFRVAGAGDCATLSKVNKMLRLCSSFNYKRQYTKPHSIPPHPIPLHSTTLNYTTRHYATLRYTTLHYATLRYTTIKYSMLPLQVQLQLQPCYPNYSDTSTRTKTTLRYTAHYPTLHYTKYITLGYIFWMCCQSQTWERNRNRMILDLGPVSTSGLHSAQFAMATVCLVGSGMRPYS